MVKKICMIFVIIICILSVTSCVNNNTTSSNLSTPSINENESSKNENNDNKEKRTITFKQYDCDLFLRDNKTVIVFYDELISTTVKEFEKGYFLSYKELDEISMSLNYVVPELNGDGYWSFTYFYYDKDLLEEGGILRDVYLNEDLIVYYGIYG